MVQFERAHLESQRFGIEVLRAVGHRDEWVHVREGAVARGADLVIARCDAADVTGIHALESAGALLMDTHLSYERSTSAAPPGEGARVDPAQPGDADAVAALSREAFREYSGHFHADVRLAEHATDVYVDWAVRSVRDPALADVVLLARDELGLLGFSTLRVDGHVAVGVLDAVAHRARGRGIYTHLGNARIREAQRRGAERLLVRTHLTNLGARRGLARLGFLPSAQEHTFHLWADGQVGSTPK